MVGKRKKRNHRKSERSFAASCKQLRKKALKVFRESGLEQAVDTAEAKASELLAASGVPRALDRFSEYADEVAERTGTKKMAMKVSKQVSDGFDAVTGAKILELVEQRLEIQSKFNDILATKLDEALEKLKMLEEKARHNKNED